MPTDDVRVADDLSVRVGDGPGSGPAHARVAPPKTRGYGSAVVLVIVGAVALGVVLWLIDFGKGWAGFDQPTYTWFLDHRASAITPVMRVVSALASETVLPFIVLLVMVVIAWRTRHLYAVVLLAVSMVLAVVLAEVFKLGLHRHRPPTATMIGTIETNGSFPSFHTLGATTLVLVLGYLWCRTGRTAVRVLIWVVGSVLVFVIVASSRLYLGFHWASDVLASAALAVIILGIIVGVDRVLGPRWARRSR